MIIRKGTTAQQLDRMGEYKKITKPIPFLALPLFSLRRIWKRNKPIHRYQISCEWLKLWRSQNEK